ncbi:MAG: dockerin type I repeat-containing protein [Oscillospiraceae bacterium]|nr:dockerin type I repeat-containing protein [Oscillospiraceae bacterium]
MNKKFLLSVLFSAVILSPFSLQTNAETYDIMYGDINGDNTADISDLSMLSLYLIGDLTLDDEQLLKADVKKDNDINIADLAHFKQYVMHEKGIRLGESGTSDAVLPQSTVIEDDEFSEFICDRNTSSTYETNYPLMSIDDYNILKSYDTTGEISEYYGITEENAEEYFRNNIIFLKIIETTGKETADVSSIFIDTNKSEPTLYMNIDIYADSVVRVAERRIRTVTASVPIDKLPDLENFRFESRLPDVLENDIPIQGAIVKIISENEYLLESDLGLFRFNLSGKAVDYCAVTPEDLVVGSRIIVYTDKFLSEPSYPIELDKISRIYKNDKDTHGILRQPAIKLTGTIKGMNNNTIVLDTHDKIIAVPLQYDYTKLQNITKQELTEGKNVIVICSPNIIENIYVNNYVYQIEPTTEVLPVKYTGTLDSISKNEESGYYNLLFNVDDYGMTSVSVSENNPPLLFNVSLDDLKNGDRLEITASPYIAEIDPAIISDVRAIKLLENIPQDIVMMSSEYQFVCDRPFSGTVKGDLPRTFETWDEFVEATEGSDDSIYDVITEETFEENSVILALSRGMSGSASAYVKSVTINHSEYPKRYLEITYKSFTPSISTSDNTYRMMVAVIPKSKLTDVDTSDIRISSEYSGYSHRVTGTITECDDNRFTINTGNGKVSFTVSDTETVFEGTKKAELKTGDIVMIYFYSDKENISNVTLDEPVFVVDKARLNTLT